MPELPEMETYRNLLQKTVVAKPILSVDIHREKTVNVSVEEFILRVKTHRVLDVSRRGKYIVFGLDSDDALLLHLMLGGWLYTGSTDDQPQHKSQVIFTFSHHQQLFFLGLRLGYLHVLTRSDVNAKLRDLGPDPLDPSLTVEEFQALLKRGVGPLKTALVNQHVISGIGNRYADEICFEAGIRPLRRIPELDEREFARLHHAMHTVLQRALSLGGYMEHPFSQDDERTGGYNSHFLVYHRGGKPCLHCGRCIVKTEHAGRKVFYCAFCQQ